MLKVEVAADHYVKVRSLIKGLFARSKDDAKAEASQKPFSVIMKWPVAMLKVETAADHFEKVRGLIKGLTARLKDDAKAETSQKSSL